MTGNNNETVNILVFFQYIILVQQNNRRARVMEV